MKLFAEHLDRLGIRRIVEKRFNKISQTERMGGLFKRHLATLSRQTGRPWPQVLRQAELKWNSSYVSKLRMGVPNDWNANNFDKLIARLYEKEPVRMHAMYAVGGSLEESDLKDLFKYKPGDSVQVSMRTLSKRIREPVSSICKCQRNKLL